MTSQIMRFLKSKSGFSQKLNQNRVPVMVEPTVEGVINICVTFRMDSSTPRVDIDKPSWGPTNRETIQKKLRLHYGYIEFVTTSGTFNLNFMENHDFNDLGKAVTKILDFMCSDGPVR